MARPYRIICAAMAYAIERGESITRALPRIIVERIDAAYEQLLDQDETPEERVHNARKRFKETRAALRMIRFSLGRQFAAENVWFRNAGRDLASLRDVDAMIEAIDKLAELADGFHDRRVLRLLRRRLVRRQQRAKRDELQSRISNAAAQLPIAKARMTLLPPLPDRFGTIGDGLVRTYRDGRRMFSEAVAAPSPVAFHEWRKRVKDHWYHAQILRHVWPEVMKPYRDQMELLSDALGERHDLDVLQQLVVDGGVFQREYDMRVIHALIDRRSAEHTAAALLLGERIYAEPPRAIYERFDSHWSAWRID